MVSNEVVMQTVKRMLSSGVDDATIRATLQGINLSAQEIERVLGEAKGVPSRRAAGNAAETGDGDLDETGESGEEETGAEGPEEDFDEGAEVRGEGLKSEVRSMAQEQSAQHATTHSILDEHSGKIEGVHKNIDALHEKFDSAPKISAESIAKLEALDSRISSLEREVSETKANTKALQSLLEKILEANRKMLLELQKKK
ncbi:MAG TPA: hypothetical protein VFF09_02365 [archaeon]|nr:hypothetical protein [archaeon]